MSFYERQEAARRQSRWLVLAFAAAVALVVGLLSTVVLVMLFRGEVPLSEGVTEEPALALSVVLFWLLVVMGSSVYRSLGLRDGGGAVATALGGTRVDRTTADLDLRRLHNVVEEMAIASGVPVPEVYVLDGESSINAFAAGHSPANAAVAVTRGTLATLTREELQGVIAHEFSHILNGDMRLNIRLTGWLFGLMSIALVGRTLMGLARHARKEAAGFVAIGLVIFMFGWAGRGLGRVIQAGVSRQRERLADASAVQFTRNPEGLKGALLKIAALPAAGRLGSARVDEVAHMLFVPGLRGLLSTHPSLGERLVALDPGFRVERLAEIAAEYRRAWDRLEAARAGPATTAGEGGAGGSGLQHLERLLLPAVAAQIAEQVGNPGTLQIALAHELRLSLPASFTAWSESPARACALMLATLLSRDPAQRAAQRAAIDESMGPPVGAAVDAAAPVAATLPPLLRLPAVCELFPALRRLPREERVRLSGLVGRLAMVDRELDVFEFCLQRLVFNSLVDQLEARDGHGDGALATSFAPLGILFSVLATHGATGSATPQAARAAFDAGLATVLPGGRRPELSVPPEWPRRLWAALTQLEKLQPLAKRRLVEALVVTISHDEQLTVAEAELLRTVCAVLRCPLPPLLPKAVPGTA
jgi:Zn-dependent protease with chaperone function